MSCGEEFVSTDDITLITDQHKLEEYIIKNRFRIIRKLGSGGMGEIFLAEDVKLKRKVAIKSVSTSSMTDPASKARFLREAQTASQLEHPNICTIYEIYEEDDKDYIVMQYVDGVTLDHIIKLKKLSIRKIVDIAIQICSGMIQAHEKGIIHRDIKPSNIMVDNRGMVKILDFGLAKFKDRSVFKEDGMVDSNLTQKGIVLGTVAYMSPEQARGKGLDHRTDVFSFGGVLFEMLEGVNPYLADEQIVTLYNVINKQIEFKREDIPDTLQRICIKSLKKEKVERYEDFSQIKAILETFRSEHLEESSKKDEPAQTEIISQIERKKMLEEVQRTSDNEDLGEIVARIKKFKAGTERVFSTKRKHFTRIVLPVAAVLIVVFSVIFFMGGRDSGSLINRGEKFYLYLQPFESETGDQRLPAQINYLLTESLNQFDEFKTINHQTARSITGSGENEPPDMKILFEKFPVKYKLTGNIFRNGPLYRIDAELVPLGKKGKKLKITGPEFSGKQSFLTHHIDMLTKSVYDIFFAGDKNTTLRIKLIADSFGSDWKKFTQFFQGQKSYQKYQISESLSFFERSRDLLYSKYMMADLHMFSGDREKARVLLDELIPELERMPLGIQWEIQAHKARLDFNFEEEISNLTKLIERFPFSKKAFYNLGEAYFHHGMADKAIPHYRKAIELDKNYSKAINHLGYCYSHMGDHQLALQLFEDYKTLDQSANSYDSLADGYFFKGDYIRADSFKGMAIRNDSSGSPWSYITRADMFILRAQYRKAMDALERYGDLRTSSRYKSQILSKHAFIHLINRRLPDALKTIDRSLKLYDSNDINENSAENHWIRGLILLELNRISDARKELTWLEEISEKYALSPENFSAPYKSMLHLRALVAERENDISLAEKTFQELISMKHQLSYHITLYHYQYFYTEYAKFLMRSGKEEQGLKEIDLCLEYNPYYIPALWVKADILEKKGDPARFDIYDLIAETDLYGESDEDNFFRRKLKKKISTRPKA